MTHTKSRLLLDLSRGAQRVSPVCCGLLLWFRWARGEKVDQSPHGRDGHAPFYSAAKSDFKGTMVSMAFPRVFLGQKNRSQRMEVFIVIRFTPIHVNVSMDPIKHPEHGGGLVCPPLLHRPRAPRHAHPTRIHLAENPSFFG